jgi:urease accessory protein
LFFILGFFPKYIFAHEVSGGGFLNGFTHPVLGVDHLLAMISVGIVSAQMGGRAIWSVPATFVTVMTLGAAMGIYNVPFPAVENMIVISVIALGLSIAMYKKLPVYVAMAFVALFASFHGHAHGTEMPYLAKPYLYALGFVVGTTLIHLAGVAIGHYAQKFPQSQALLRYAGAMMAGMGVQMFIA